MTVIKVNRPHDQSLIQEVPEMDAEILENILSKASRLFLNPERWLPAYERIEILERAAQIMTGQIDKLTKNAAEEGGKPYHDSKVEVLRAVNGVKLAVEHIAQIKGEQIPMGHTRTSSQRLAFTMREPIGVVASVSAFNHPLNLIIHQTVPAIAVGSPVIIKPAKATPLSCFAFMDILKEAGLPDGWCTAFIGATELTEKLVTDSRINYLSFIGSAKVGWYLRSKLSPGTRCALEHGGAAPVIVEPDADLDEMLPGLLKGGFYHAGQVCVSVQRVFVHDKICDEVAQRLAAMAKELIVGDPLDEKTEVGPLIEPGEVDRVEQWVNEAVEKGAVLLCGGQRLSNFYYAPTVLLNPPEDTKISNYEVFGPVVCLFSYADRNKAIEQANSLPYAFQASAFTSNLDASLEIVKKLNATAVMVNDHTAFRVDWMPFGGRDESGIGMGGIPYSMEEMTRTKMMVIKNKYL
ncbi:NAD-dependent aldehyde dehydrogenase [Candidatus Scalindua japonica]|uniref:NAD-dependent aldehyde dehydrogenase n=1 Tax=Candidatus Scalindua japonica TaxID=1284222 RepID=A0A286U149_9BACT|nr:aldehyde dehydrogenase family protein [Candidatus Scalindua japonica]GAX61846.1 NAD-dependent aldehyde dehydrogenase [Candidatus Scalindua japonica]